MIVREAAAAAHRPSHGAVIDQAALRWPGPTRCAPIIVYGGELSFEREGCRVVG